MKLLYAFVITVTIMSLIVLFIMNLNKKRHRLVYGLVDTGIGVQRYTWFCSKRKFEYLSSSGNWKDYEHLQFKTEEEAMICLKDVLAREAAQKNRHVRKYRRIKI